MTGESPAVWLGSDRVWTPGGSSFLSACGAGGCAPVIASGLCEAPSCPGRGGVHRVARGVAPVSDWPTDYDGFTREREALIADPELVALRPHLVTHPEHAARQAEAARSRAAEEREQRRRAEDLRWVSRHRDGDRLELALSADLATLAELGGSFAGGTASVGYVAVLPARDADEDGGHFLPTFLFGDVLGVALRVHALARLDDAPAARWITAIGLAPVLENRFEDSVVRMPTFWGTAVPEVGAILRSDTDVTWYVAWDAPFSFLVDHDLAIDVAARVFLIDEWLELPDDAEEGQDDPAEVLLMLSVGARLP